MDGLDLFSAPEPEAHWRLITTSPARHIRAQYGRDPKLAARLMRATARDLLAEAKCQDALVPPTWRSRAAELSGDVIGLLCLVATVTTLTLAAGVFQ